MPQQFIVLEEPFLELDYNDPDLINYTRQPSSPHTSPTTTVCASSTTTSCISSTDSSTFQVAVQPSSYSDTLSQSQQKTALPGSAIVSEKRSRSRPEILIREVPVMQCSSTSKVGDLSPTPAWKWHNFEEERKQVLQPSPHTHNRKPTVYDQFMEKLTLKK